jgi:hypothetical protein
LQWSLFFLRYTFQKFIVLSLTQFQMK